MKKKKVVLAFSGGLDTSFCAIYLRKEMGLDVHSIYVHTGHADESQKTRVAAIANTLGITHHECIDKVQHFYQSVIRYLIFGNILKNHNYPLSVSAERVYQAIAIAEYAKQVGADYIAHGSTAAGNDQVRFDLIFNILCPEIQIVTPIRDLRLSRQQEVTYLEEHGIHLSWEQAKYSINTGLWGSSVGGAETLTSDTFLPDHAFPTPHAKTTPEKLKLTFTKGELSGINGNNMSPIEAIEQVHCLAQPFGIGRDIHVGDTIIGIKGRVGFEAAAAHIIIRAHQTLEKHTLTKWQAYWKDQLAQWYGMSLHEALYLEPAMRDIEMFLQHTQSKVSGDVFIELHPYRFVVCGIESLHDLMRSSAGVYGEMNSGWTGDDVKGFTKILGNSIHIYNQVNSVL